jgi:hypothetical protein
MIIMSAKKVLVTVSYLEKIDEFFERIAKAKSNECISFDLYSMDEIYKETQELLSKSRRMRA